MGFEVISESNQPDFEVWTCDRCGYQLVLQGVGGDVADCPRCVSREQQTEAIAEETK